MTLIGKLLAFLNLVVGLGIISWSLIVYTQRPGWLDPIPDAISPGSSPENFAQMKAEIESLNRLATAATSNWNTQRKILEGVEAKRAERLKGYEERLTWAKNGNKDGIGFFEPVYEKDGSGLLDLTPAGVGAPIKGSDNLPLKGSEKLMANFQADVTEVAKLEAQIKLQREKFQEISKDIGLTEQRLRRISEIREAVQAELFILDTFEVNVYETRETVLRRKKQLDQRLSELGKKN
jgi:hypothetical protein